jgi:hypothetical protein
MGTNRFMDMEREVKEAGHDGDTTELRNEQQ